MDSLSLEDDEMEMAINLIPMIDVLIFLLIFFIITTNFIKPVIDINLATTKSDQMGEGSGDQIVVVINKSGQLFLDDKEVTLQELDPVFSANRDSGINLFVDQATPFQDFISVVDLAKLHKRNDLVVTTKHESN
jgi:biopolymer transport protein ExbD